MEQPNFQYLLLDAAQCGIETIEGVMDLSKDKHHDSLYEFNITSNHLKNVAPYIFESNDEIVSHYLELGWGKAWGLQLTTTASFDEIRKHFRKFLKVLTEDNKKVYFRFYDPVVLRIFLPTCSLQQLKDFFGPVEEFICEDEDPQFALIFTFEKNKLVSKRVNAITIFPSVNTTRDSAIVPNEETISLNKVTEVTIELKANRPARRFFD